MPTDLPSQVSPFATLMQIAGGHSISRCLHVVADLGVADALDETPQTSEELARAVGANAGALGRVLRLLSAYGIFEDRGGRFVHTHASRLLRSDHPESMRAFVRMIGLPISWTCYGELHHSVRTGLPASRKVIPGGIWNYRAEHPEVSQLFNDAMAAKAQADVAGVVHSYDFSRFSMIGDIGGGRGHLLQAILTNTPKAKGVLFDQPHVIEQVSGAASERLRLQAGDFFKDEMPSCDVYLMMEIIHDWNDEDSVRILQNLRHSARPGATLLLVEAIIPDDPNPSWAKILDIHMLTMAGGRQRTQHEHAALLASSGFRFGREIGVGGNFSILEAVAI